MKKNYTGLKLLLAGALLIGGCGQAPGRGDKRFLLPWTDEHGRYSLQEVTISTLDSPFELKGDAAEIYLQSAFAENGFSGSVGRPHLTLAGDVYIPQNAESSLGLAVYAQIERLMQFEQKLGVAAQVPWPRKVGIELNVLGQDGSTHNNAHYIGKLDVIALVPYSLGQVPVAVNHGIVAHEHFHAHFQREVNRLLRWDDGPVASLTEKIFYLGFFPTASARPEASLDKALTIKDLNEIVLRGWNEGLADFFAATYTRTPDFFNASLPKLAKDRQLDAASAKMISLKGFTGQNVSTKDLVGFAYSEGTKLGRLLYGLSLSGNEKTTVFLVRILSRLKAIAPVVKPHATTEVLDFETVIPILLEGFPLNPASCAELRTVVTTVMLQRRFAPCMAL